MGFTLFYLCLIVLLPLLTLPARTATMTWEAFWQTVSDPRVVASYRLSIGASLAAASVNAVFGLIVAWVLVRYSFPGRRIVDSLVDLPFALPTAVAGITLTAIYAPNGWIGRLLEPYGLKVAFTRLGITIALVFIGLPFVVRTLQPVIEDLDPEVEEAATSLGATRLGVLTRIIVPYLFPAVVRAGRRRVRVGRVHLRQHADADGDRAAADHHEARTIRLPGRHGDCAGDALVVLHAAARHQPPAGMDDAPVDELRHSWVDTFTLARAREGVAPVG
jgi:sulfate ABC transporter permease protein CysT